MPASHVRKALRKRKFAPAGPHEETISLSEAPSAKRTKASPAEDAPADNAPAVDAPAADADPDADPDSAAVDADGEPSKQHRFLLFVGNLPWECTVKGLAAHFASVQPSAIRHRTDKKTGQSRGFAFLEFERYDRMEDCLKRFHHSIYEEPFGKPLEGKAEDCGDGAENEGEGDGQGETKSQKKKKKDEKGRRINVELTVGGGGSKSSHRRDRLYDKNAKLKLERKKERQKQQEEKAKEKKTGGGDKRTPKHGVPTPQQDAEGDASGIHPSRRAQVRTRGR